jgi:hypothetical protein
VLDQRSYNREEAKDERRKHKNKQLRPLEERESYRWMKTLGESSAGIPEGAKAVSVCDREGDMYELFGVAEQAGPLFLI